MLIDARLVAAQGRARASRRLGPSPQRMFLRPGKRRHACWWRTRWTPRRAGPRGELSPEASWAKKGGRRYFGYKAHVGVDLGSNIIRVAHLTTAAVADTTAADGPILGDAAAVYADKAYDTKARRAALTP